MQRSQLEKTWKAFNPQQKKRFPTLQSYIDEVHRRDGNRLKANRAGEEANRKGAEIAKRNNEEYDEFIRENPEMETRRIKGKLYTRDEYNTERDRLAREKYIRENPTRHAWNEKFFTPAVQGLTNIADTFIDAAPQPIAELYKNFAPPTSKFYENNLLKAVGVGGGLSLSEAVAQPLSGSDVQRWMKGAKMYTFKDLRNVHSVKELLGKHKCAIILYELEPHNGHWTMVFEHNNPAKDIECFDSLGFAPDSEIGFIPKSFREESRQDHTHLLHLLANVPNKIFYNEDPLQKDAPGVNTCGRWCVFRYALNNMSIKQFQQFCKKNKIDDATVAQVVS